MTKNPYLKRLLGEGAEHSAQTELAAPPETLPATDDAQPTEEPLEQPASDPVSDPGAVTPTTQQLAQQWKGGDHVGVATALMFTAASYKDFVNLVYIIGQEAGLELGQLLDELADSEDIEPPKTPPQYSSILKRVSGAPEEGVL